MADFEKEVTPSYTTHVEDVKHDIDLVDNHAAQSTDDAFSWSVVKFIALFSISLGFAGDVFYVQSVGSLLSVINAEIGPSTAYPWIVTTFALGSATLSPLTGRLSDIYGRRYVLLAGAVASLIGGVIGARAKNINTLIGAGAFMGAGIACHIQAFASASELVPKKSRGLAMGGLEAFFGLVGAFAALTGRLLVERGTWRYIYWIQFAANGASFILIIFFYHPINQYIKEEGESRLSQLKHFDWVGSFLFLVGLVLFLMGLSFGGAQFPWKSAGTLVPIILGFALLLACGLWEAYVPLAYPIFPPVIFRNWRGFTLVNFSAFLVGILYYASLVLWPIQVQSLYTTDPIKVGWYACAFGLGSPFGSIGLGYAIKLTSNPHWWLRGLVGGVLIITGCQAIVSPTSFVGSTILVVLSGALVSAVTVVALVITQVSVEHEFIGIATSINNTARSVGGTIATVVYVIIFTNRLTENVVPDIATPLAVAGVPLKSIPLVIQALLTGDATSSVFATLTPAQLGAAVSGVKWAYAHALRTVYLSSIAFGVLGCVIVAFIANVNHLMTKQIDIQLEEGAHLHGHTDTSKANHAHSEE